MARFRAEPALGMEEDDPQLFRSIPARQTREDLKAALAARLGELPPQPETGFIGRGHELLALQRLLRDERYVVVRGQGGAVRPLDGPLAQDSSRRVPLSRDAQQSRRGA